MIVGEAPGRDEELEGKPFVGASGRELRLMLQEVGIRIKECYVTNVCKYRPPNNDISNWIVKATKKTDADTYPHIKDGYACNDYVWEGIGELQKEIAERQPKIVIGFGNTPLWALMGEHGITNWRGSEMVMEHDYGRVRIPFVPTYHPAGVMRNWEWRAQVVHDLKQRVVKRLRFGFATPVWNFNIKPTFDEVMVRLRTLNGRVAGDIETSKNQIVCIGLAWSARDAMCIPMRDESGPYWTPQQEEEIIRTVCEVLGAESYIDLIGQNFTYDASMIEGCWGPRLYPKLDTMIGQSVLFPGQPRGLGFLSSMYCEWHHYWKDDARDWNNIKDFQGLFHYNCRDCCATWEAMHSILRALDRAGLMMQFQDRMAYARHVYNMQQRGLERDEAEVKRIDAEIEDALQERLLVVADKAGHPVNLQSPKQVGAFFFDELGCRRIANKKSKVEGSVTTGDEALQLIIERHPEHADVANAILEYRSLASIRSNFVKAKLDPDGRLRSSFSPTGTETFRLTSSKTSFKRGANLLNVTDGEHVHSGRSLPNLRKIIVPDPGYTMFEMDQKKADVQIVAWEAEDEVLKQMLREGADIHTENAKVIFNISEVPPQRYAFGKTFVHLTNYGGMARTAAIKCGCTVHEADQGQRRWFAAHPGIKKWHQRIENELLLKRAVFNKFGYRIVYFDRPDGLLGQALAWVPQSTVALVSSYAHAEIEKKIPEVQVLLQVYDSVMGQYPTELEDVILPKLSRIADSIVIPYKDPLIIPMDLKTSTKSWGDCEKRKWPTTERENETHDSNTSPRIVLA
jgi:uracil-DNA glycosylase family 4